MPEAWYVIWPLTFTSTVHLWQINSRSYHGNSPMSFFDCRVFSVSKISYSKQLLGNLASSNQIH